VKAQSPVTEIGNSTDYGSYFDDGGGLPNDQNVLINNNPNAPRIIGAGFNEVINPTAELNFLGGEDNQVDGNGGVATANLLYGKDNQVRNSDYSVGFGSSNSIRGISNNSLAVGKGNRIDECKGCASIGIENRLKVPMMGGAFSIGAFHNNTNFASLLLGFGDDSNPLSSIGDRSISLGTYNNSSNIAFNTLNIRPPGISAAGNFDAPVTGIGTTSPSAKLEIQNKGENDNTAQALSVLNSDGAPLFNVREDGWTGFSADPSAPYYFTETSNSPMGFSGGEGKANIVQDLGGFPFINTGNKWISVGERPPDGSNNQIAYGYAATWDNFAGNFFMDDVDQDGTKDLTISFQDAGVTDPDNASNRMRFIARDGDKIFQSGAFNELMSLYPEGEVAVGDYSGSVNPDAQLEVKGDPNDNISTLFEVLEGGSSSSRGNEVLTVNDNGNVGIGLNNPSAQLEVTTNNPIKDNAGDWAGASDKRLKKNIENYQDGLKELMQIRPVWYQFNSKMDHRNNPDEKYVGVIAQETKEVAPYMVEKSYEVDGKKYYSLNSTAFTYMLINAVQEQEKKLESKDEQIDKLQKRDQQQQEAIEELKGKYEQLVEKIKGNEDKVNRFKKSGKEDLNEKTVSIGEAVHDEAMLLQNRPNPYNNKTIIPYYLPENFQSASLVISSTNGKLIERVNLNKTGKGEVTLQTANLDQGQYIYSLIVDGRKKASRKMIKQ
jgi:hypothetical protein